MTGDVRCLSSSHLVPQMVWAHLSSSWTPTVPALLILMSSAPELLTPPPPIPIPLPSLILLVPEASIGQARSARKHTLHTLGILSKVCCWDGG